ncbi:MAG: hypothetical protein R2856_36480 [Caldilineaceae bacterium]
MHPSTTKQDPRAVFLQAIADMGIQDVHGVEMLRLIKMAANAYDIILADRMREEEVSEPRWRMLLRLWMEEQSGSETYRPHS